MEYSQGILFEESFQKSLKDKFYYVDEDPVYGRRLFFENSGGSLRLKRALLYRMLEGSEKVPGLRHIPGVKVCVDTPDLTGRDLIAAIAIDGMDMTACVAEYQKRGVTVFERVNTSIYSKRIVEALGLEGAIRVSPLHCHGVEDIDRFLDITGEIAKLHR